MVRHGAHDVPGIVVVDANVLRHLEDDALRTRVRTSLAAADLRIWPSALNALEAANTESSSLRARLLRTVRELADGRPMLPLPTALLRDAGQAIANGARAIRLRPTGLEWLLQESAVVVDEARHLLRENLDSRQAEWDEAHREARRLISEQLGGKDPFGSVTAFLDRQWTLEARLGDTIRMFWDRMHLPGEAPVERVLRNETWRLYLEAFGATVYERAVHRQTLSIAHVVDVDQLVYLGGSPRRVLVTDDGALRRIASAVLLGRYTGARVMSSSELLAST